MSWSTGARIAVSAEHRRGKASEDYQHRTGLQKTTGGETKTKPKT